MNLLAIDTSAEILSLAVSREAAIHVRHERAGHRHAELILGLIEALMDESGLTASDLHGIAYGSGPGSFTGLRIACGVAQGLALAWSLKVVGVSTLLALAGESGEERVIACINARMGEVYYAAFRRNGAGWEEVLGPCLGTPDSLPLPDGDGWVGCGDGFMVLGDELGARFGGSLRAVRAELAPTAASVLLLARASFERGEGLVPANAIPAYLRDKVALKTSER